LVIAMDSRGLCFRAEWRAAVTNIAISHEPVVSGPPGVAADLKMLARWISLGGRLAVRVLALAVFALLSGLGVVALARDVSGIL
jgi:hypothetical protein